MKLRLWVGFFMLMMFVFSCKSKFSKTPQDFNKKWMLIEFNDFKKEKLIEKECFIDFRNKENARAEMGCNGLGFEYSIKENNKISFSQITTTYIFCEDNAIESDFLKVVHLIDSYKIEGHKLYLKTNSNQELIFIAEDWD